ncbi:MAG: metallophosphoesterase [Chloroflexi bacterium]|nr:metallophosphoesterase [Chloroflexota bacterium]
MKRPLSWLLAGLAALGWYSWRVEPRWLRIKHLTLIVPGLPRAFDSYRIGHLSDLHLGVRLIQEHLPLVVQAINREQPDLLAITGDFATGQRDGLTTARDVLAAFHAPDGVWATLGNHDYHVGVDRVMALLDAAGINVLCNAHHTITRGPDQLVLAGVDDVIYGVADLNATLYRVNHGSPVVLLAHEPDYARIAVADPRIMLQLSGHTHGGQIRVPGLRPLILPKLGHLYPAGSFQIGHLALFVTTGTGTGRFVLRFNCRPEIAIITLRCGPIHTEKSL